MLASWIRESDEALFARFFAPHRLLEVYNARVGAVGEPGVEEVLARAGGLLLTGGPDISAQFHNVPVSDETLIRDPEPERDRWELAAVRIALERGLPVFCICKGLQVLNVALGGTLHLHVEGHGLPEQRDNNIQAVRYGNGARHRFEHVNSSHHQAIERLGDGLEVQAWAAEDDIIEQVQLRGHRFCTGVQFHPERDLLYAPLFEEFFAQVIHERPFHSSSIG